MANFYWEGVHYTDWTQPTAWVTTDGGSTHPAGAPTASDTCYFTSTSSTANCTVNTSSCVCGVLNVTTWAKDLGIASGKKLTVSGNITLGSSMTCSGTGQLSPVEDETPTWTSNGVTVTYQIYFLDSNEFTDPPVITLADDWTVTGGLYMVNEQDGGAALTLNGNKLYLSGILKTNASGAYYASIKGTTEIVLNGTCTWSDVTGGGQVNTISNNLTINASGNTVTISGTVYYKTGTLTYTAGTVTTTSSTLNLRGACTLATNGVTWNNVTFATGGTYTLSSNLTATGTTTIAGIMVLNSSTLYVASLNLSAASSTCSGTTAIIINNTGTWSAYGVGNYVANNLTINASGKTVTIGTNVAYATGTLTYTAGTVVTTSSTLTLRGACTLATTGINWNNVTFGVAGTYTLSSTLSVDGTLTISTEVTLNTGTITASGSLTMNGSILGTSSIILDGTGTWSGGAFKCVQINLEINTAGTITLSGIVYYMSGLLKYTAGNVITTNSTLYINGSCSLDISSITLNNVSIQSYAPITLSVTTGLKATGAIVAGREFTIDNFVITGPPSVITLAQATTVTVSSTFSIIGTATNRVSLISDGSAAIVSMASGTGTVMYTDIGLINATGGAVFNANSRTNTFTYGDVTGWLVPNNMATMAVTNN